MRVIVINLFKRRWTWGWNTINILCDWDKINLGHYYWVCMQCRIVLRCVIWIINSILNWPWLYIFHGFWNTQSFLQHYDFAKLYVSYSREMNVMNCDNRRVVLPFDIANTCIRSPIHFKRTAAQSHSADVANGILFRAHIRRNVSIMNRNLWILRTS